MRFHFIYNNRDFYYSFESCYIEQEHNRYCPVCRDLHDMLVNSDEDTKVILLRSVLHAYHHGRFDGENDKLRDIRRVLGVNFN